ncbi:LOW QUALITY PROTEIN: hypothetical protein ACHAWF_004518 [Thalassiosira exigua]
MSHAMGRTLVLPPEQRMYLLDKSNGEQRSAFGFDDFFHLDAIAVEHKGFKVIAMEEFLIRSAMRGELLSFPPGNRTSWVGGVVGRHSITSLWKYLRSVSTWDAWKCALAIPSSTDPSDAKELNDTFQSIMDGSYGKPRPTLEEFHGNPVPVNANMAERMREMLADRDGLCIYDQPLRESKVIHLKVADGVRYLTHFYALIFFAVCYMPSCSGSPSGSMHEPLRHIYLYRLKARSVEQEVRPGPPAIRRRNDNHDASCHRGIYDAMHVRRGDFQFTPTRLPAEKQFELSEGGLSKGATLYIATDEKDKSFFDVFRRNYDVVFLDDFRHVLPGINTNYYGMIDQLVAYKSRVFYGTWWSTLSGYHKLEGYEDGTMNREADVASVAFSRPQKSWYLTSEERVEQMRTYIPVLTRYRQGNRGISERIT